MLANKIQESVVFLTLTVVYHSMGIVYLISCCICEVCYHVPLIFLFFIFMPVYFFSLANCQGINNNFNRCYRVVNNSRQGTI